MSTRLEDIHDILQNNGIDVYYPGYHTGECNAPYTVIKPTGASRVGQLSTNMHTYDVMCYVPEKQFTTLETYVDSVKTVMKKLYPMIKPTQFQTPAYFDADVKGHMVSVQYQNYRKIPNNFS